MRTLGRRVFGRSRRSLRRPAPRRCTARTPLCGRSKSCQVLALLRSVLFAAICFAGLLWLHMQPVENMKQHTAS